MSTILHPGVYYESPERKGVKSIESLVRAEMRANGYPTTSCFDTPCTQPDICDKITDCPLSGSGACATNGLTLFEEPACIGLGGTLGVDTVINTSTFDFSVTKGGVGVSVEGDGSVAIAQFEGVNGTSTVFTGVRSLGSNINFTSQFYNSASDFSIIQESDNVLERHELVVSKGADESYIFVTPTTIQTKGAFQMILPTHANNAAAVSAGLVATTLYKTATGEVRIVV